MPQNNFDLNIWYYNHKHASTVRSLRYVQISMLKSMLANKYFQTWHLIGWQHSRQPIKSHVRKPLSTDMEFNMNFT